MKRFSLRTIGFSAALAVCWAIHAQATVVVTPGNMDGWTFYKTDGDPTYTYGAGNAVTEMVNGPSAPPLGTGSAHFNTGTDGSQSAQIRNSDWAGTAIADLTSLGYSTYATSWNGQQMPFLNLYLSNGDRLWFEPAYSDAGAGNGNGSPQADPVLNTWQTWNALNGMWYSDNFGGPGSHAITWAQILADEGTGVTIVQNGTRGGIRIASGFASSADNFNAYVDNFTIGTAAGTTTYDFELTATAVPEPTTMIAGALLLLPFGASTLRILRKRTA